MRLVYADYNPLINSIDVTTFENLDGEMQAWVDAIDSMEAQRIRQVIKCW